MSKAFTRESDDHPEPRTPRLQLRLPTGVRNYLTPDGAAHFQEQLKRLIEIERPTLVAAPAESSEYRYRLQALEQKIQELRQALHLAEVVPPPPKPWDQVRFGALVGVRDGRGEESHYRIVGVTEMDADRGWVSWLSPIAKALLQGRLGQRIRFKSPAGEQQLEILSIAYPEPNSD